MFKKFEGNELLLATNNKDKIAEIATYFAANNINIKLITPCKLHIEEPEETQKTFIGNAELKARHYGKASQMISLSDDTGVCVDALGGLPGVDTAHWAGPNKDFKVGIDRIQRELKERGINDNFPKAHCVCVLSLYWPKEDIMHSFEGIIHGNLNFEYRNQPGFGFQPVFVPEGHTKSFGMMTNEERDSVGHHRIQAFNKLLKACF